MATFDEFYESLPEDSNRRGEYFEKVFVPWFLKTDPEWSTQVKEVWLWDDYPHRWGKDCGIDLVYEDRQGKHWAVQSKCISPEREISKAEIDSFLSESSDPSIHGRLLIASTDGIGKNAQQVIDRQEKQVVCFLLENFRHSSVEFPSSPEDLTTGQRKEKRIPRPHQQEAIRNVVKGFETEDRGQLLMACGTGKTLTALWIKEALNAKRTLVLVPSLGLLSQTLREWAATSQQQFNWICVCSDKSVAKQDKTADNLIERVSGLGVPVTSDPKDIQDFLENEDGGVVFSTYQSSELVADSQKDQSTPRFDITFADEAHRCTGKISSAFACVLDGERIRSGKRLFMTATPRVLSKRIKKKADEENIDLSCMDDVSQFGDVFHQLNFSEAIERELLSDYQVVIVGVDDPAVEAKIISRSIVHTGDGLESDTETLANHIALAKAIKDYDLKRLITFHSRVRSAKKFCEDHLSIQEWMPEKSNTDKDLSCSHVSGEMPTKERNSAINKLRNIGKNEVGILTNARCLSEGVDVPSLDGIAFMDPKRSQVDIIQALGRAIRKSENKKDGYIILPVYLGDTTNIEDSILQSRFANVWRIILALKSQDDALRETLDQLRIEIGSRGKFQRNPEGLKKIIFDLPSNIPKTFAESISTILVIETTENWIEKYGQLKQYITKNGNTKVPIDHPSLGIWVSRQRQQKTKGRLPKERVRLLDEVGFIWDHLAYEWKEKYLELKEFIDHNQDANLPGKGTSLGDWMVSQRKAKREGKLSNERIQLLDKIGFSWDPIRDEWEKNYNNLIEYYNENGDTLVPWNFPKLGKWVQRQRKIKSSGKMPDERARLLEKIGFSWDPIGEEWDRKYLLLEEYAANNGDTFVHYKYPVIGGWVADQRDARLRGKLSEKRIQLLDKIGFCWDPLSEEWQRKYNELKEFILKNGTAKVPHNHPTLAKWVQVQRVRYSNGKIPEERLHLLEKIGFIWNAFDQEWDEKYLKIKELISQNGHARIPNNYPILGAWVGNQRQAKKKGKLSEARIDLLNSIGFIWDAKEFDWQRRFSELKKYVLANGDARISSSHPSMGNWVSKQRQAKKKGKLSEEQIQLLDSVGFIWDTSNNQ